YLCTQFLKEMKKRDLHDQDQNLDVSMNMNADENVDGNQHLNEPVTDESELEKLKQQVEELNDRYLRQLAEFDNFRRRTAKERVELKDTAGKEVITDLLDV